MFTVELNGKTYKVHKVTARALREIGPVQDVFRRLGKEDEKQDIKKDMDTLVNWFVLFCGNQFTADDVYDHYPSDRIMADVGIAVAHVNAQVTERLVNFPTGQDDKKKDRPVRTRWAAWCARFTGSFFRRGTP